jgi:hypothetical protein
MANSVFIIGLNPDELPWMRALVRLLRHPDPAIPELARQAVLYLEAAADSHEPRIDARPPLDHTG